MEEQSSNNATQGNTEDRSSWTLEDWKAHAIRTENTMRDHNLFLERKLFHYSYDAHKQPKITFVEFRSLMADIQDKKKVGRVVEALSRSTGKAQKYSIICFCLANQYKHEHGEQVSFRITYEGNAMWMLHDHLSGKSESLVSNREKLPLIPLDRMKAIGRHLRYLVDKDKRERAEQEERSAE